MAQKILKEKMKKIFKSLEVIAILKDFDLDPHDKKSNKFRIATYEGILETIEGIPEENFLTDLNQSLKKGSLEKVEIILQEGILQTSFNDVIIDTKKSYLTNDEILNEKIEGYLCLEPLAKSKVGIGKATVGKLLNMGYRTIDEVAQDSEGLGTIVKKGIQKYQNGIVKGKKISRDVATDIVNSLNDTFNQIQKEVGKEFNYKIAGSYSRGSLEIGDIDYVITVNGSSEQFLKVYEELVGQFSNCITKSFNYDTFNIKFMLNTHVEIYGYYCRDTNPIFAYMDRHFEKSVQIMLRKNAHKFNCRLSWKGFTDLSGSSIVSVDNSSFETVEDIHEFLTTF